MIQGGDSSRFSLESFAVLSLNLCNRYDSVDAIIPSLPNRAHSPKADGFDFFVSAEFASRREYHFTGTRYFSFSNQFTTMLISGRGPAAPVAPDSFIIKNRLPSGLMSHGVSSKEDS
jgi:hypothetical protein